MQKKNEFKAAKLYHEIDENPLFEGTTEKEDRSKMNVTFRLTEESKKETFDKLWNEFRSVFAHQVVDELVDLTAPNIKEIIMVVVVGIVLAVDVPHIFDIPNIAVLVAVIAQFLCGKFLNFHRKNPHVELVGPDQRFHVRKAQDVIEVLNHVIKKLRHARDIVNLHRGANGDFGIVKLRP